MIGQGRPTPSQAILPCAFHVLLAWVLGIALVLCCCSPSLAAPTTLRLRIAWGGGAEQRWQGSLELSQGSFSELRPLGIEADESGSIWLADNKITIRTRTGRAYDGVDVLVTAEQDAKLTVSLTTADKTDAPQLVAIPLHKLVNQSYNGPLDEVGNQLLAMRAPGDKLRIALPRSSLVFAPGEMLRCTVEPHLLGLPAGSPLRLKAQLALAAGSRGWSSEYELVVAEEGEAPKTTAIEVKLPEAEGVYELTVAAINANLRERLPWRKPLAERKVQLVVVGEQPLEAPPADSQSLVRVVEIDPANPRAWDRLAKLPLMPGARKEPLSNGQSARWSHPTLGPLVQLGNGAGIGAAGGKNPEGKATENLGTDAAVASTSGGASDMGWEAYPVEITAVDQPHLLEVEYPSDVPQSMGISVVEPNAAGAVMPIGFDSGVFVAEEEAGSSPQMARHKLVFWPRTKTPLVLITNRSQRARAVYGKIRISAFSSPRKRSLAWPDNAPVVLGRAYAAESVGNRRLLAGYLDRPLFSENFSAHEALDAFSHRSLDDWTTFYQGGTRLVEYLNHVGYNGLMLTVLADGSTIYPTQRLESTPRHDTGVFFANGQDPVRKDVLELLFRLFDREGLQLIPAVHFDAPLADVEKLSRAAADNADGLEWIGAGGPGPGAPRTRHAYNPLDPRVQQAMLDVVGELAERYSAHASFGGISVQLAPDGFAQLPGADGSFDDATVARFEQETKVRVPGEGAERYAARGRFFAGSAARTWLNWRADNMARFYHRVEQVITSSHPGARLYLAGATMFDGPQVRRNLRPALPRKLKLDDVLLSMGLRSEALGDDEGLVFLRPQRIEPLHSLAAQAVDMELNAASDVDRLAGTAASGASLFYHEPQKARLESFDAKSPFGSGNTYTWLVAQMSPSGNRNRERFIRSLAARDAQAMFDGGWLLPLGQEDSLEELISVYRQLPSGRFETFAGETQPVIIRSRVEQGQTFVYLANDSPWPATVDLAVEMPADCRLERLGAGRGAAPVVRDAKGASWRVALGPYGLVGARFTSPQIKLRDPRVSLAGNVETALERRIQDLSARTAALATPRALQVLKNAGFEQAAEADGAIVGWSFAGQPGAQAMLDSNQKREGGQSLKLTAAERQAAIVSEPFAPPDTGRLSVALWLRIADPQRQPALRLAVEGKQNEGRYYRFATVGGNAGENNVGPVPLAGQWSQYIFQIDDVPSESLAELRIRFELLRPGEVWIDDVELFDLAFSPNERVELTKIIGLADFKLKTGEFGDCHRLLESYWPQYLLAHVPLTQTPTSLAQRPQRIGRSGQRPAPAPVKKPGMLDQMKGYVPKFMQF